MKDSLERLVTSIRSSQGLRLLFLGFLVLLLQIPISMINGLVSERQQRRQAAIDEVSSKWGNAQSITGPALVLPYSHHWTETAEDGATITRTEARNAVFLPEQLRIRGTMDSEIRHRGIFSVPVYKLGLVVEGEFTRPRLSELGIEARDVDWARAHLAVGISDARAIQEATSISWNEKRVAFLPGTGGFMEGGTGIHAPVGMADTTQRVKFSFPLSLNGSLRMDVVPFGQNTVVDIRGNHGNPSFQGNWLPIQRTVSSGAFQARWSISFLGRSYPQAWTLAERHPFQTGDEATSGTDMQKVINASRFGVELMDPVDHYHMAARSVKYAGLFILLTFATVWLIEILAGVRVHSIQYLMLGGALCLFYLLELSLSEHLGFPFAYVAASAAVIGMVAAYSVVVLRRLTRAIVVGAGVTLLYAYLYLLLMNEDYALLIGSVGLFAILGAIMFATRRVDWYAAGVRTLESPVAQA
jgi:inner membrane protein